MSSGKKTPWGGVLITSNRVYITPYALTSKGGIMRIYNGTGNHPVNIVVGATVNPANGKLFGGEIIKVIPPSGMLRARIDTVQTDELDGIPVFKSHVVGCDPLPEGDWDVFIVSVLYAKAYTMLYGPDTRLYIISQPVMSEDGSTFVGCCGIVPYSE